MAKKTAKDGHTYDVSATANATVAPTNANTLTQIMPKVDTQEEIDFISIMEYEWSLNPGTFSLDYIKKEYLLNVEELLNRPKVKAHLLSSGIPVGLLSPEASQQVGKFKLSYIQLRVAAALMDMHDTRPLKKKLQDHGVNTRVYQSWIKNPDFQGYMQQLAENLVGSEIQHEAMLALADKVMSGDLAAIKYYHALTGRYIEPSSRGGSDTSTHDMQQMIVKIVEIIIDEVDDRDTAIAISERIKGLVIGQAAAGIMDVAIQQPEIAKPRELTPKMQEMMDRGVGVND